MEAKAKTPPKTLSVICGVWPFFSLYTNQNYLEIYFQTKSKSYKFTVQGLFQIINEDQIQTDFVSWQRKTHKLSMLGEPRTFLLDPRGACSICSKLYSIFEWIIFAPPGSILQIKLFLACPNKRFLEINIFLGISSYGILKSKADCLSASRSVIVKNYNTFLLFNKILLNKASQQEQEIRSTLANNFQLTFSSVPKTFNITKPNETNLTEISKQKSYIKTLNLHDESYELYKLHTESNFLTIKIKQLSNIRHMINLCGIVGMYILEEVHDMTLTYGPYCNTSKFDALNGDTFEFYSHTKNVTIVFYNFNPILEPTFLIKLHAHQSKCQGVANVCYLFSRLTPDRYF